jgi:hypothetical protein
MRISFLGERFARLARHRHLIHGNGLVALGEGEGFRIN